VKTFNDAGAWATAFDYVREKDQPEVVVVNGRKHKLYPSGRVLCAEGYPYHPYEGDECHCWDMDPGEGLHIATFSFDDVRRAMT